MRPTYMMYCWDIFCASPERFTAPLEPGRVYFGFAVEDWSRAFSLIQWIGNRADRIKKKPQSKATAMVWADMQTGEAAGNEDGATSDAEREQNTRAGQQLVVLSTHYKINRVRERLGVKARDMDSRTLLDMPGLGERESRTAANNYFENLVTAVLSAMPKKGKQSKPSAVKRNAAPVLSLEDCAKFVSELEERCEFLVSQGETEGPSEEELFALLDSVRGKYGPKSAVGESGPLALDPLENLAAMAEQLNNQLDTEEIHATRDALEALGEQIPDDANFKLDTDAILTSEISISDVTFTDAMKKLGYDPDAYYETKNDPDESKRNVIRFRTPEHLKKFPSLRDIGFNLCQIIGKLPHMMVQWSRPLASHLWLASGHDHFPPFMAGLWSRPLSPHL